MNTTTSSHPRSEAPALSGPPDPTGYGPRPNPVGSAPVSNAAVLAGVLSLFLANCGDVGTTAAETSAKPAAPPAAAAPGDPARAAAFAAEAGKRVEEKPNVPGDDPAWYFLTRELKQVSLGDFWEKDWKEVARNQTDPLPSMVEFNDLLKGKGVELIVAPIPAKATIYPDKLAGGFAPGEAPSLAPFIGKMRAAGLRVIDLEPVFLARRASNPDEKLYCEQDAHYSPLACEIVAELVKKEVENAEWFQAQAKEAIVRGEPTELEITGDQVKGSEWEGRAAREKLMVRYAGRDNGGRIEPVDARRESPVLLIGDSHTLVFQEGASNGMHCKGAGLLDQLAYEFQFPPDHVGVRGSGMVQARRQLFPVATGTPGYWEGKKLVVWVFSSREFTQSFDKLISIPIERK
ncbi:MAG: hypothetical protein H7A52_07760 [Akkermansiaceae bacterium]|nr:hypothetical protein [Akkermansiaceae bacterium]